MRAGVRLVCLALVLACGREGRDPASGSDSAALAQADSQGRIDPAPYRAQIEATEALLYSDDALSDDGWKALSKSLLDLHNLIVFSDGARSARETSARLFFLSARADAMSTSRHDEVELAQLRELWRKLCADKLAPVSWIHAQSEDAG